MKYKTLFRLLLKAVGVMLFVQGLATAIGQAGWMLSILSRSGPPGLKWGYLFRIVAPCLEATIGLYLFFGGKWLADKAIPGNRPYCQECGYDLTGAVRDRCPECDTPFRIEEVQPAGR